MAPRLILASASTVRGRLLRDAGIAFEAVSADIDEAAIKSQSQLAGRTVKDTALQLAKEKAAVVSAQYPDALVIGADQMLKQDDRWFDKPHNRDEARAHLKVFRGHAHDLVTAAVVLEGGTLVWERLETVTLSVRAMSDGFIETYLDQIGDDAFHSVGAYQLEGRGVQIFDAIEGDFFTILGLPLLPLLGFLRQRAVCGT